MEDMSVVVKDKVIVEILPTTVGLVCSYEA